jgi:hypothetical protein
MNIPTRHAIAWHLYRLIGLLLFAASAALQAKPIAFQGGSTLMFEYGAGTMQEAQFFYAPSYWYSLGGGHLRIDADDDSFSRDITYLRGNLLVKRWNLPRAQANVFTWGSLGSASISEERDRVFASNLGAQADYETLRVYSSLRTDWHHSTDFDHRIDTLQLGWAPYPHDYTRLATWLVFQARHYTGGIYEGVETAALLRFFKGNTWVEAGITNDGKLQAMFMFNF